MKLARLAGMVGIFGVVPVKFTKAAKFIQVGSRDEAEVPVVLLEVAATVFIPDCVTPFADTVVPVLCPDAVVSGDTKG